MPAPTGVEFVRTSTRRVLESIDDLTDEQAHEPSRLPDWNRAEVITHLARNADAMRGMLEAAARGEVGLMYPSAEQRAAGIAAGRDERAAALRSDLRHSVDQLMEAYAALPDDAWERKGKASATRTMREFVTIRWRELEVHHVDLDLGYESSDWPVTFVSGALNDIFSTFEARAISARPLIDVDYRVISTDHECAWRVAIRGAQVKVSLDDGTEPADGEARGWGCDIVAWLYGRDPRGGGIVASGDLGVLRLPRWFPYG